MSFDLDGHKFIVTGAARGIGLGVSRRFFELGALVSGWDRDTSDIRSDSTFAHVAEIDVTDEEQVKSATDNAVQQLGGLHGLVANAGINGRTKPTWEYSLNEWNQVINIDLTGAFISAKSVLDFLIKEGYGRLIFMASVAGKEGNPMATAYGAAKAGMIGLAKGLSRELLPSNITVNCIAPAITETGLMTEMTEEYILKKKSKIPMGRFCTVTEIADMAAWVASPRCSFTTGQVFDVTGGRATY